MESMISKGRLRDGSITPAMVLDPLGTPALGTEDSDIDVFVITLPRHLTFS